MSRSPSSRGSARAASPEAHAPAKGFWWPVQGRQSHGDASRPYAAARGEARGDAPACGSEAAAAAAAAADGVACGNRSRSHWPAAAGAKITRPAAAAPRQFNSLTMPSASRPGRDTSANPALRRLAADHGRARDLAHQPQPIPRWISRPCSSFYLVSPWATAVACLPVLLLRAAPPARLPPIAPPLALLLSPSATSTTRLRLEIWRRLRPLPWSPPAPSAGPRSARHCGALPRVRTSTGTRAMPPLRLHCSPNRTIINKNSSSRSSSSSSTTTTAQKTRYPCR